MNSYAMPEKLKEFLDFVNANQQKDLSPHELREMTNAVLKDFQEAKLPGVGSEDKTIEHDGRSITTRHYYPENDTGKQQLFFIHGGGHMTGNIDVYDALTNNLAHHLNSEVISIEYALAPEHPYPAGLNDCIKAVITYADEHKNIFVAGDSAGGNKTASLTYQLSNQINFAGQILIYPSLDFTMSSLSMQTLGIGYLLQQEKIAFYYGHYLGHHDPKQCSPLHFDDFSRYPKTLLFIAGLDPLRDEAFAFRDKLLAAGVETDVCYFDHMIHAYMSLASLCPDQVAKSYQQIQRFCHSF